MSSAMTTSRGEIVESVAEPITTLEEARLPLSPQDIGIFCIEVKISVKMRVPVNERSIFM